MRYRQNSLQYRKIDRQPCTMLLHRAGEGFIVVVCFCLVDVSKQPAYFSVKVTAFGQIEFVAQAIAVLQYTGAADAECTCNFFVGLF